MRRILIETDFNPIHTPLSARMTPIVRRAAAACVRAALVAGLAVGLAGCATFAPSERRTAEDLNPTLTRTIFFEEGDLAFIAIDTRTVRAHREAEVLGIPFLYLNKSEETVELTAEGIVLYDEDGTAYPLVPYTEFRAKHASWLGIDRRMSKQFFEITNQRMGIEARPTRYRFTPLSFYGEDVLYSGTMLVPDNHFTRGTIYFPMPATGVEDKRFDLVVSSKDLADDIVLKFRTE